MSHRILGTLGMKCPKPLFEVHRQVKDMEVGDTIEVSADDPAFRLDIEAWCRRTGHELVDLKDQADRIVAMIRKAVSK